MPGGKTTAEIPSLPLTVFAQESPRQWPNVRPYEPPTLTRELETLEMLILDNLSLSKRKRRIRVNKIKTC